MFWLQYKINCFLARYRPIIIISVRFWNDVYSIIWCERIHNKYSIYLFLFIFMPKLLCLIQFFPSKQKAKITRNNVGLSIIFISFFLWKNTLQFFVSNCWHDRMEKRYLLLHNVDSFHIMVGGCVLIKAIVEDLGPKCFFWRI